MRVYLKQKRKTEFGGDAERIEMRVYLKKKKLNLRVTWREKRHVCNFV